MVLHRDTALMHYLMLEFGLFLERGKVLVQLPESLYLGKAGVFRPELSGTYTRLRYLDSRPRIALLHFYH